MSESKTKKALIGSAGALVLCFALLLGTTFAWFTDNASTKVNKIQAGNLDVALEMKTDDGWVSAEGETLNFVSKDGGTELLWEPGCSYYTDDIRIVNEGNLALKFKVDVTGLGGDADLNKVIKWGLLNARDNESYDSNDELSSQYTWSWKNTSGGESYSPLDDEFYLLPGEYVYMQLIAEMDKDAGNQYQGLSIDGIAITVCATQYTHEYDSTTNQYDKDAAYSAVVANAAEFVNALKDENVTEVVISEDITYDWGRKSYTNAENLIMQGKTISGLTGKETLTFVGYGSANNVKNVTLMNLKVADKTDGDSEGAWEHGYLEFDNLTANNVYFVDQIQLNETCVLNNCTLNGTAGQYAAWVNSGNTTFNNCSVQGGRSIKVHEAYGSDVTSVVVDGCTFTTTEKPGVVIGTVDSTTSITIKNSTFTDVPAGDQGKYFYESDTNVGSFNFIETGNTHN